MPRLKVIVPYWWRWYQFLDAYNFCPCSPADLHIFLAPKHWITEQICSGDHELPITVSPRRIGKEYPWIDLEYNFAVFLSPIGFHSSMSLVAKRFRVSRLCFRTDLCLLGGYNLVGVALAVVTVLGACSDMSLALFGSCTLDGVLLCTEDSPSSANLMRLLTEEDLDAVGDTGWRDDFRGGGLVRMPVIWGLVDLGCRWLQVISSC